MTKKKVIISRVSSYKQKALRQGIENIFSEAVDSSSFFGKKVFVKPNLLLADPPEMLSCTNPLFIKEVLSVIIDAGGKPFLSDIPIMGSIRQVCRKNGLVEICKDLGVEIVKAKKKTLIKPHDGFPSIPPISSLVLECDHIINLPKLKVHDQLCLTMAVKNMFGCVKLGKRIKCHQAKEHSTEHFAKMLVSLCLAVSPTLNILDAVVAMDTNGPRGGNRVETGMIIGGENAFSVDLVASEILGANKVPTVEAAKKMNVEGSKGEDVCIIGDKRAYEGFRLPEQSPINFSLFRSIKIAIRDKFKRAVNEE